MSEVTPPTPATPAAPAAPANPNPPADPKAVTPPTDPGANAPAIVPATPPDDPAKPPVDPNKPPAAPLASENWREELAGGDEKVLERLKRLPSQKDLVKSWIEQNDLIRSGKHKNQPLPKDATPEQVKEYREANGIPETADGYYKALPEGLTFGEADKPGVTAFLADMHGMNVPQPIVAKALERFVAAQEEAALARVEMDDKLAVDGRLALKEEWGVDYKTNINAVQGFVEANFPQEVQAALLNARLGDESMTPLMSHPGVVKAMAQLGRTLNPTGTSTPGAGMDKMDSIDEAIKGYENRMKTDRKGWFKDEKAQSHYRELLTAKEKMSKKAR